MAMPRLVAFASVVMSALVAFAGEAAAPASTPDPAGATSEPQKPTVMLEFRVVTLPKAELETLDIGAPEPGEVRTEPTLRNGFEMDGLIDSLERGQRAKLISRPFVLVPLGEQAAVESGAPGGSRLKLWMRPHARPEGGFACDLEIEYESGDQTVSMKQEGLALPSTAVRCDEAGQCLLVITHARAQG